MQKLLFEQYSDRASSDNFDESAIRISSKIFENFCNPVKNISNFQVGLNLALDLASSCCVHETFMLLAEVSSVTG